MAEPASAGPAAPGPAAAGPAPDDGEALRALQDRLQRAATTAQRLLDEAAAREGLPAAGWRAQATEDTEAAGDGDDVARLLGTLTALLEWVPLELQQRLVLAARELLQALRALVDWCLERLERRRAQPLDVQDIPIL